MPVLGCISFVIVAIPQKTLLRKSYKHLRAKHIQRIVCHDPHEFPLEHKWGNVGQYSAHSFQYNESESTKKHHKKELLQSHMIVLCFPLCSTKNTGLQCIQVSE